METGMGIEMTEQLQTVKKCCEDMPEYMYKVVTIYVNKDGKDVFTTTRIDIEQDDYSDLEGVKFCMYCGKRLQVQ
jgi:hypothetical protein